MRCTVGSVLRSCDIFFLNIYCFSCLACFSKFILSLRNSPVSLQAGHRLFFEGRYQLSSACREQDHHFLRSGHVPVIQVALALFTGNFTFLKVPFLPEFQAKLWLLSSTPWSEKVLAFYCQDWNILTDPNEVFLCFINNCFVYWTVTQEAFSSNLRMSPYSDGWREFLTPSAEEGEEIQHK